MAEPPTYGHNNGIKYKIKVQSPSDDHGPNN